MSNIARNPDRRTDRTVDADTEPIADNGRQGVPPAHRRDLSDEEFARALRQSLAENVELLRRLA